LLGLEDLAGVGVDHFLRVLHDHVALRLDGPFHAGSLHPERLLGRPSGSLFDIPAPPAPRRYKGHGEDSDEECGEATVAAHGGPPTAIANQAAAWSPPLAEPCERSNNHAGREDYSCNLYAGDAIVPLGVLADRCQ